jgi:hypothetical protein
MPWGITNPNSWMAWMSGVGNGTHLWAFCKRDGISWLTRQHSESSVCCTLRINHIYLFPARKAHEFHRNSLFVYFVCPQTFKSPLALETWLKRMQETWPTLINSDQTWLYKLLNAACRWWIVIWMGQLGNFVLESVQSASWTHPPRNIGFVWTFCVNHCQPCLLNLMFFRHFSNVKIYHLPFLETFPLGVQLFDRKNCRTPAIRGACSFETMDEIVICICPRGLGSPQWRWQELLWDKEKVSWLGFCRGSVARVQSRVKVVAILCFQSIPLGEAL